MLERCFADQLSLRSVDARICHHALQIHVGADRIARDGDLVRDRRHEASDRFISGKKGLDAGGEIVGIDVAPSVGEHFDCRDGFPRPAQIRRTPVQDPRAHHEEGGTERKTKCPASAHLQGCGRRSQLPQLFDDICR